MHIYLIVLVIDPFYIISVFAQIVPAGAMGSALTCSCLFSEPYLTFWHYKAPRAYLLFPLPCPAPRMRRFSKQSWLLLLGDGVWKPRSGPECACALGLLSLLLGNTCLY